jgi:hypothetical protein
VAFYGVLILIYGLSALGKPLPSRALANLHPDIWWGAIMLAIGGTYVVKFYPRRRK